VSRLRDTDPDLGALAGGSSPRILRAYLLGSVEWDQVLHMQRRLIYEVSGTSGSSAVLICEHPPSITIGREGSREHIRCDVGYLERQGWSVRWHARGGGVMLHLPGQLACYPIVVLSQFGWTPAQYVQCLQEIVIDLLRSYGLSASPDRRCPGVVIGGRRIAHVGVAIRNGVTCFGMVLNVDPDLQPFYRVRCDGDDKPMTSLQREICGRFRISGVRQRLLEILQQHLNIDRLSIFHTFPDLLPRLRSHVTITRS
jgi:lipoyl(octanoyl) transferase